MGNKFDEMRDAVSEARTTLNAADAASNTMSGLLIGRLRKVSNGHLRELKKELTEFNARTGKWKN